MTTYNVTANFQTIQPDAANATINLGNFSNVFVYSYQGGGPSDAVINLDGSSSSSIYAYVGDTVVAGTGLLLDNLHSVGHNNLFLLGDSNSFVNGLSNDDTVLAGNGNNLVYVGDLSSNPAINVVLSFGNGNNQIQLATQDTVTVGNGNNIIYSYYFYHDDVVTLGDGNNQVGLANSSTLIGGDGDNSVGSVGNNEKITLGNGNNSVSGNFDDVIELGRGNNTINMGFNDTVTAGNGDNVVVANSVVNIIHPGPQSDGNDVVTLGQGNNSVLLGDWSTLVAGNGTDVVDAGHHSGDKISLGNGDDTVALWSNDTVTAVNGTDVINVTRYASNDLITLGDGDDAINASGASGNLTINLGAGDDVIDGSGSSGIFAVNIGAGDDFFNFENVDDGALTINQLAGTNLDDIDLTGGHFQYVSATVGNAADIIALGDASIGDFTLNVAVDGFKLPDGYDLFATSNQTSPTAAVVNYLDTGEVINSAYAKAVPLPYFIAELVNAPLPHWNDTLGQAVTLDFSFMQSLPGYANTYDGDDFTALGPNAPAGLTPQQILAEAKSGTLGVRLTGTESQALTALAAWESVANVTFVSATDSDSVAVRFGANEQLDLGSVSYSYLPPPGSDPSSTDTGEAGDVYVESEFLNPLSPYYSLMPIAYIHEIGHVLGLGGESGTSDPYDLLPGGTIGVGGGQDSGIYTVMSYDNPPGSSNTGITTPQIFDIAVAQYLYGADPNYNPNPSHDWTFSHTAYRASATTAQNTANLIDGGGINTIDAGTWAGAAYIDLRQGHWSWEGAPSTNVLDAGQLFIDYGTTVDTANAQSTTGAVTIVGNDGDNLIMCGQGADLVVVGAGNDSVVGSLGDDTVLFASAYDDYSITALGGNVYTVTALDPSYGGTVTLTNIRNLAFSDQTLLGFDAADLSDLTAGQLAAMSPADFGSLSLDVLNSLTATVAAELTTTQVRGLTSAQIGALTATALDAFTPKEIAAFATAQLRGLTSTQLSALAPATLGALASGEIAAVIGVLTASEIGALTASQLGGLSTADIVVLTTTQFGGLSADQLGAFSTTQIAVLSTTKIAALTTTQVYGLSTRDIAGLTASQASVLTITQLNGLSANQLLALTATQIGAMTAQYAAIVG